MSQKTVNVLRLSIFSKRAKKLLTEAEIESLRLIFRNTLKRELSFRALGDCIPVGNKGKRGGSRLIYYYHLPDSVVLLLSAYAKSQQEDLDTAEKRILKSVLAQYFDE